MTHLMTNRQSIRPRWLICSHHEIIHHCKPIPFVRRIYFPGLCTTKTNELPRDRARVCFIPRPRDQISDQRDKEECGAGGELNTVSHVRYPGNREKSQNLKKTIRFFGIKMKISAGCCSQMSGPPGFVDTTREKLPHFWHLHCLQFCCLHAAAQTSWRRQEASDMKYELFTQNLKPEFL